MSNNKDDARVQREVFKAWRATQPVNSDTLISDFQAYLAAHPTPKSYWVEYSFHSLGGGAVRGIRGGPLHRLMLANSYTRMGAVLNCRRRPDFFKILGNEWDVCDNVWAHTPRLRRMLIRRGCPIPEAMTADEYARYVALPTNVTVCRGCYRRNINGLSWSLDRNQAERFPFYARYRHFRGRPLLVKGVVRKENIFFLKLVRDEQEVVTLPEYVRQRFVSFLPFPEPEQPK